MYNGCRTDVLYNVKDSFLVFIEHQSTSRRICLARFLEYVVEVSRISYNNKKETAKRCLSIGLPMNKIVEVTGLTNSGK